MQYLTFFLLHYYSIAILFIVMRIYAINHIKWHNISVENETEIYLIYYIEIQLSKLRGNKHEITFQNKYN